MRPPPTDTELDAVPPSGAVSAAEAGPPRSDTGSGGTEHARPVVNPVAMRVIVGVVGAASLGSEIALARLVAPYFGASTIVWANTIAIVLVALSFGYWWGGRLADRPPGPGVLCAPGPAAAVGLAIVPYVAKPLLDAGTRALDAISVGAFAGSLL